MNKDERNREKQRKEGRKKKNLQKKHQKPNQRKSVKNFWAGQLVVHHSPSVVFFTEGGFKKIGKI